MAITGLRLACAMAAAATLALAGIAYAAEPTAADDPWPDLAQSIFKDRPLLDGSGVIALEMPARAEDAAFVPLALRRVLPVADGRQVKAITVVIDENPSPVAAVFTLGPKANVSAISTHVRVNSYTNVHVVAELSDGKLYVVTTYVKASGGCSAPAAKNAAEAEARLGEMQFRLLAAADSAPVSKPREAEIAIRHPNNSGLQMDQVTHLYVPAFFIEDLKVWQGDDLVLAMESGISISENPSIRFTYLPSGSASVRAQAVDTEKRVFKGEWPATGSPM